MSEIYKPHNIEAEQGLLGAILINNEAFQRISETVEAEHFFEPVHRAIFEIISNLVAAGKLASPITVKPFLPEKIEGTEMTAAQYCARLAATATTVVNAVDYAKHVRELADQRAVEAIALGMAPHAAASAVQLASDAIEALDTIITSHAVVGSQTVDMRQAMAGAVDRIARNYARSGEVTGIPYGLKDLDHKTLGMSKGNLVVLAGRPGMGKSAVVLGVLRKAAESGSVIRFQSLEMSEEELTDRMISDMVFDDRSQAHVPYNALKSGNFHENVFDRVRDAAVTLSHLKIKIDTQAGLTMSQVAARARRQKRREGLDVLAIDHLDLLKASNRYSGNRTYELMEITSGLKMLAKELDIVIILLSQLSREVEKREDKRPILADLRSSGSIEQDADVVIFLYRASYYLANKEPAQGTPEYEKWMTDCENAHNKLLAIVAKQRQGPTGSVELFCDIGSNAVRDLGVDRHMPSHR